MAFSIQHYVIQFVSGLRQVGDFLLTLRIPPLIKLTPRYNWHIVKRGIKKTPDKWYERNRVVVRGGSRGVGRTRRAPPLKLEKKYDFFCVKSWFFTRNTPKIFAPPSARRNFLKCAPLTWNPGSAPGCVMLSYFPLTTFNTSSSFKSQLVHLNHITYHLSVVFCPIPLWLYVKTALWVRIPSRRGVLDITLCDTVCQWLAAGRWFSPDTTDSSTNKTLCINHNCYLCMPSWGPDLVNKLISISISILCFCCVHILGSEITSF
jgi:hypothetical protein